MSYAAERLAQLERGEGDFTDLQRPAPEVIRRARDVAARLLQPGTPTPSVVPSELGEVLFVWHKAGWTVDVEVGAEETSVVAYAHRSGTMWGGPVDELWPKVSEVLMPPLSHEHR